MKKILTQSKMYAIAFLMITLSLGFSGVSHGQNLDSKGTDFWLTMPGNLPGGSGIVLTLFISSEVNTSGVVTVPGIGFTAPFTTTVGNVTSIIVPTTAELTASDVITNLGIHVTSVLEVTVYGLDRRSNTTDAFLGLPTDVLGMEYINLGYQNVNVVNATQMAIVATQNATTVTIIPSVTTGTRTAGVPYNLVMNQGQTYMIRNTDASPADLSGSIITSNKPIAVFGSHQCANIPNGGVVACDYLIEQLPPTNAWGKNFVTIPLKTRLNGDTFRFLASADNTVVKLNGITIATLNRGQFHERIVSGYNQVTSDKPILVAQYSNSTSYDGVTSDPFMMLIFPFEQFLNNYTVTTPASGFAFNFINVAAPNAAIGAVKLDGVVIPAGAFTPIGATGFSGAQMTVGLGVHVLNGTSLPFGVFVYGFDNADSYGYPGGGLFGAVATSSSIVIAPKTGSGSACTSACWTATVKDQFNNPVVGVRVDFTVTGTNPSSSGFAFTNASGVATFCYTGPNVGGDNIVASVGTLSDGATYTWTTCNIGTCDPVTNRLYVDASVATSGTGGGWVCAIKELSDAIVMANANPAIKSIWVADGTYKPTTGTDRTISMSVTRPDIRILGGFAGGEVNATDANPTVNLTIISGDIGVAGDMSDNSYRLMNILTSTVNANGIFVDGFIFEKGNADAPGDGDRSVAAALYSYLVPTGTPVNIRRSVFRNNYGTAAGAVFLHATNAGFDSCHFTGNITNGVAGGALMYQCSPTFNNCVFAGNTATNAGGGFYGNYGNAVFNKTTFSGNSAGTGGAVYLNRYNAEVSNCLFNANSSISGGGALFVHNASNSNITNSTFYKNSAATSGGAIVLVEANSAINAGNNIFYKNSANGAARGAGSDINNLTTGANVYANNILQMGTSVPADNGTTIRNNTRGTDPLFVNEANPKGADNLWATADDGLQLTNASPAKNTGDNALAPAGTDITNSPRIVCAIVDKGAYENQGPCGPIAEEQGAEFTKIQSGSATTGIVTNPFGSDLQIRYAGSEKCAATVYAGSGKTMWGKTNIGEGITHADAGNWSRGMYQLVLTTANGKRMVFKVVKL